MAEGRRRWLKWILGAVVLVAVLAVAGPFIFIHFIEGPAPKPLALTHDTGNDTPTTGSGDSPTTAAQGTAGASLDGTWKIGSGSQAGYRVEEILVGQSTTAVGRTSKVTGQMTMAGTKVSDSNVVVDLTSVSSDKSQRDSQFHGRIMDTAHYPTATFTLTDTVAIGQLPAEGKTIKARDTGTLEMHGTKKAVIVEVEAQRLNGGIQVTGAIPVTFSDYGIPNPTFGPAKVGDTGTIEFLVNYTR